MSRLPEAVSQMEEAYADSGREEFAEALSIRLKIPVREALRHIESRNHD